MNLTYTMGNAWRVPASLPPPRVLSMADIAGPVALHYGVRLKDLQGPTRTRALCEVRWEAMWALRLQRNRYGKPRWSLPQIARFFNRDHTTVIHALRQHAKRLAQQQEAA